MLTRIVCPNCRHVGATAASLPRVLTCSQCGHDALIRSGKPARPIQEAAENGLNVGAGQSAAVLFTPITDVDWWSPTAPTP